MGLGVLTVSTPIVSEAVVGIWEDCHKMNPIITEITTTTIATMTPTGNFFGVGGGAKTSIYIYFIKLFTLGASWYIDASVKTHPVGISPWPCDVVFTAAVVQKTRHLWGEHERKNAQHEQNNPHVQFHLQISTKFIFTHPSITYIFDTRRRW